MEQPKPSSSNCLVIAISAVSGGGKSTLAKSLVPLLDDAITLHFDEYTSAYCSTSTHHGTKPVEDLAREAYTHIQLLSS